MNKCWSSCEHFGHNVSCYTVKVFHSPYNQGPVQTEQRVAKAVTKSLSPEVIKWHLLYKTQEYEEGT